MASFLIRALEYGEMTRSWRGLDLLLRHFLPDIRCPMCLAISGISRPPPVVSILLLDLIGLRSTQVTYISAIPTAGFGLLALCQSKFLRAAVGYPKKLTCFDGFYSNCGVNYPSACSLCSHPSSFVCSHPSSVHCVHPPRSRRSMKTNHTLHPC